MWALYQPGATCEVIDHVQLTVFGIDSVFTYVRDKNITKEFVFSVRTFGRSIRIDMVGIVHLSFVFRDPFTGDEMYMEPSVSADVLEDLEYNR